MPMMPGGIKQHEDKTLMMEPAWIYDSGVKLALYWQPSMEDTLFMDVVTSDILRINSAEFVIGAEPVTLLRIDITSHNADTGIGISGYSGVAFGGGNVSSYAGTVMHKTVNVWSTNVFVLERSTLERILKSDKVTFKAHTSSGIRQGLFSTDFFTTARPAFKEFLTKIKETQNVR
jgi:hypothetical protein